MLQNETSLLGDLNASVRALTETLPYPEYILLVGLFALSVGGVLVLIWCVRQMLRLYSHFNRQVSMAAMSGDETPGSKILIAKFKGFSGHPVRKGVLSALETKLSEFNFGSTFYLGTCPLDIRASGTALTRHDHEQLSSAFKESGADLIVWGEVGRKVDGTVICFTTPGLLRDFVERGVFSMKIAIPVRHWDENEYRAIAYVAGKRLRPGLAKPDSFKAERLEPIIRSMGELITGEPVLTGRAQSELEDDYAAAALHLGRELKSPHWLEISVTCRKRAIANMKLSDNPPRWIQARIDLGRALTLQCEHAFDAVKLQEAMTHIREAVEATSADTRIKLAESGFEALKTAETLLADRRKYSIRWTV